VSHEIFTEAAFEEGVAARREDVVGRRCHTPSS
jgi:hypothetical protein